MMKTLIINTDQVNNSSEEKLLGVTFNNDFCVLLTLKICAKRQVKSYMLYIESVNILH